MSMFLEKLIRALRNGGVVADYRQLEESIWLSRLRFAREMGGTLARPSASESTLPSESIIPEPNHQTPQLPTEILHTPPRKAVINNESTSVYAKSRSSAHVDRVKAKPISVPGVPSLQHTLEINHAMRPLLRRVPSKRIIELDEESTTQQSAESRILMPVFRPGLERWFDISIVVEDKPSMIIWR